MDFVTEHRRARRGAAYLDKRAPRGWRRKIRLRELSMMSVHKCVLGQLYGSYLDACVRLGLSELAAKRLGFDGCTSAEAWKQVLRR